MSVHSVFGMCVLVLLGLVEPLGAQERVPPALRPIRPGATSVIPRQLAVPDTLLTVEATANGKIRDALPSDRPRSPVPGVAFAGDPALARRGLGGPTLNGFAALAPLTTLLGQLTPYVSGGLVGRRWDQASPPRGSAASVSALPLVPERRVLADQLVENEFSRFFGVGLAGRIGPLQLSVEMRHVRTRRVDGMQGLIRGQIPLRLPF